MECLILLGLIVISSILLYDRPIGTRKPKTDLGEKIKYIKPPKS